MLFSYDCSLKMFFPFVWILLLSSTRSLQSLGHFYEPPGISPGRVETSISRGGQLRCSFVANLLQYMCANNYQNTMWCDKVTAKTERVPFFVAVYCIIKYPHPRYATGQLQHASFPFFLLHFGFQFFHFFFFPFPFLRFPCYPFPFYPRRFVSTSYSDLSFDSSTVDYFFANTFFLIIVWIYNR